MLRDLISIVGIYVGLMVVVCVPVFGLVAWVDSAACYIKAEAVEKPASWGFLQGCIVEVRPGVRIPMENYRVVAE